MENKRFAFMVAAYTEPTSFAALMKKLNSDDIDIYVHVDKKVDITPFTKAFESKRVFSFQRKNE